MYPETTHAIYDLLNAEFADIQSADETVLFRRANVNNYPFCQQF